MEPVGRLSLKARDDRFLRAAAIVLKEYTITRRPALEDGWVVFDIQGGTKDYVVKVHPEWRGQPQCSCPDAAQRARDDTRGYCKHIIATLLKHEEFRGQLLEVFL